MFGLIQRFWRLQRGRVWFVSTLFEMLGSDLGKRLFFMCKTLLFPLSFLFFSVLVCRCIKRRALG